MENSKKGWSLIIVSLCIILGVVVFLIFNNKNSQSTTIEWDIKINEYWNNPLAGRRMHEQRCLLIDSKNCIGKITYLDEKSEYKETNKFKISKKDITKILNLADKGTETNERESEETYTVYKIETNTKTTFVDLKEDKENIISNLFID